MHFTPTEILLASLILSSMLMGASFTALRQRGADFVAAIDRSALFGGSLFALGGILAFMF